jgi:hypothetical protein
MSGGFGCPALRKNARFVSEIGLPCPAPLLVCEAFVTARLGIHTTPFLLASALDQGWGETPCWKMWRAMKCKNVRGGRGLHTRRRNKFVGSPPTFTTFVSSFNLILSAGSLSDHP